MNVLKGKILTSFCDSVEISNMTMIKKCIVGYIRAAACFKESSKLIVTVSVPRFSSFIFAHIECQENYMLLKE